MSNHDEEQERRARAEELRRQIRGIKSEDTAEGPEMKPGESPKEYLERRQREMENKKKPGDVSG